MFVIWEQALRTGTSKPVMEDGKIKIWKTYSKASAESRRLNSLFPHLFSYRVGNAVFVEDVTEEENGNLDRKRKCNSNKKAHSKV
jgi:hypothetical protein